MDNAGGVYIVGNDNTLSKYAIGAGAASATYTPTANVTTYLIAVSPQGTLFASGLNEVNSVYTENFDEWDPGTTGAPSRTVTRAVPDAYYGQPPMVGPDGTLYVAYMDANGNPYFDAIAPGTTNVTRTIPLFSGFEGGEAAADANGTLYVAENNYTGSDANAGLYVYPVSGAMTEAATGAAIPTALDIDDAGNVYVVNSNSVNGECSLPSDDTIHEYTEFAPGATSILKQVTSGFTNAQTLSVTGDGKQTYMLDQTTQDDSAGLVEITPGATNATTLAAVTGRAAIIFDGMRAKEIRRGGVAFAFGSSKAAAQRARNHTHGRKRDC